MVACVGCLLSDNVGCIVRYLVGLLDGVTFGCNVPTDGLYVGSCVGDLEGCTVCDVGLIERDVDGAFVGCIVATDGLNVGLFESDVVGFMV